jgi:hypothetical protein
VPRHDLGSYGDGMMVLPRPWDLHSSGGGGDGGGGGGGIRPAAMVAASVIVHTAVPVS